MKKNLLFVIIMLLSMVSTKASAHDIEVENADGVTIYYNYINDGTELEVARGNYSGDVNIPDEVTYMGTTLKVTAIEEMAFAFGNNLISVSIGNNVKTIGNEAFSDSENLLSVNFGNSVTSIGEKAFYNCFRLTSLTLPNSVTSIGDEAFAYSYGIYSLNFGDGLLSIGQQAFYGCTGIIDLSIPNSVETIGDRAFFSCNGLISVSFGDGLESIGIEAFSHCEKLTSLSFGNGLASIGEKAFSFCPLLSSVTLPNSVTTVGSQAFYNCNGLTSVVIGNSVTEIGNEAFICGSLALVESFITEPHDIAENCFMTETYNLGKLMVPAGTIDKYRAAEGWKNFVNIEEGFIGLAEIDGINYFVNTDEQTAEVRPKSDGYSGDVVIPPTIEYEGVTCDVILIADFTFNNCTDLTSITIPNSVTA